MTIEELIDLQEAGSRARILGLKANENPYLSPDRRPNEDAILVGDWVVRRDAWEFGWEAENASRDGKISQYFRELINVQANA